MAHNSPDSFKVRYRSKKKEPGRDIEGDDLIPNLLEEALKIWRFPLQNLKKGS